MVDDLPSRRTHAILWSSIVRDGYFIQPDRSPEVTTGILLYSDWLSLSAADRKWLDGTPHRDTPSVMADFDPDQVESTYDVAMRDRSSQAAKVLNTLYVEVEQCDAMINYTDEHIGSLDLDRGGLLTIGERAWRLVEASLQTADDAVEARGLLNTLPGVRVLDVPDGPIRPGAGGDYERFDEYNLAVALDPSLDVPDLARMILAAADMTLTPPAPMPSFVAEYLVQREGPDKARIFAVQEGPRGRELRAVLRCRSTEVAEILAGMLDETKFEEDSAIDPADVIAYAEEHLSAASVIAVRNELDRKFLQ